MYHGKSGDVAWVGGPQNKELRTLEAIKEIIKTTIHNNKTQAVESTVGGTTSQRASSFMTGKWGNTVSARWTENKK